MKPIKGKIPNKKPAPNFGLAETMYFANNIVELKDIKERLSKALVSKLEEVSEQVDTAIEKVNTTVEKAKEDLVDHANNVIEEIQKLEYVKGEKGEDADEDRIVAKVIAKIPNMVQIEQQVLSKVPKIDEDKLLKRFISQLPNNKADLKIIQKNFETDPMSVIDKIMALPEGKFKLKTKHIDGLEQTISSMRNQLSRGYLHGAGIDQVIHDATLTGKGTLTDPLSVVSVPEADTLQSVTDRGATTTVQSTFSGGLLSPQLKATSTAGILFESTNGTDVALMGASNTSTALFYGAVNVTANLTVNTNQLVVDTATGFNGIGVTTPAYKWDVRGASGLDGATPITINIQSTNSGTWTDEAIPAQLLFSTSDGTGGAGTRGAIKLFADDTTGADTGLSFFTTTSGAGGVTERMRISHNGNVGIGTTSTESATTNFALSVVGSGLQLLGSDTVTASTIKSFRMGSLHYDNATNTRPVIGWYMSNESTANTIFFGGGTSTGYAATEIRLYTASDTTTQTGSRRASIDSTGRFMMGSGTAVGALTVTENRSFAGMTTSVSGRVFSTEVMTITDTDQSGTIANRNAVAFRGPTFASTNSVTLTESASVYITAAPTAGTNTTITNPYAFWVDAGRTRLDGGVRLGYRAVTASTTADVNTDYVIRATSGTFVVNLPTAVGNTGQIFIIKNSGSGTISVTPSGAELIDDGSPFPLSQYDSVTIMSTGAGWIVI